MRDNIKNKIYPINAKPFEILTKTYLFGDRKLIDVSYCHVRFYKTLDAAIDALRDLGFGDLSYDVIHPRNSKLISYRRKKVLLTKDDNGFYKNITDLARKKLNTITISAS